jgi:hypothetical protein
MSIATASDFETAPVRPLATPLVLGQRRVGTWGFRAWRLERYFAKTPAERLISPDSGKG